MKKIITLLVATPILTLFLGIGVLALNISSTWDERNTDVFIANMTAVCGIAGVVVALMLSALIALAFYSRWRRDIERPSARPKLLPAASPDWDSPPPLQLEVPKGKLYTAGPEAYEDLEDDMFLENTDETDWRYS